MGTPTPVECLESPACCFPSAPFYGQGETFLNAQTGLLLDCPPGFSCDAGFYPTIIIVRKGEIPFTPPPGVSPLRFTCCDGSVAVRYLPDGFTFAEFAAAAQSIVDEAAAKLAQCKADQYNSLHARRNPNCAITTASNLPGADVGVAYSVTLAQTGATAPLVWSLFSGSLPSGLSLSSAGVLSGTPMTSGNSAFVVLLTGATNTCKKVFHLVVSSDVPCDLGLPDDTVITPDVAIDPTDVLDTGQWASVPLGQYALSYVGGSVQVVGPSPNWFVNPPTTVGPTAGEAQYTWNDFGSTARGKLPYSFCSEANSGDAEADFDTTNLACCPDAALFAGPQGRSTLNFQHALGNINIDVHDSGWALNSVGSSLPTFRLTRTKKTAIDYQSIQLRLVNLASLLSSLTPFDGCIAGGVAPVWNGEFTSFDPVQLFVNYAYKISGPVPQLNSTRLEAPAVTKVYHDTAGQDTPTGCAWILAIAYDHPSGNRVSWVGLGGAGYSPVGTYVFSSTVVGWTMTGKKTAWRVATTVALPANTRTLNVLTASGNGTLPAIDGVSLALADRVLVKNEGSGENNGSYVVTDLGSGITPWVLTRSTDLDTDAEMIRGIFAPVTEGNVNAGLHFRLVTNPPITLNVTVLSFTAIATTIEVESF